MPDIFKSADYAREKIQPAPCENDQHAWGVRSDLATFYCQICGATRDSDPRLSHQQIRERYPTQSGKL